MVEYGNGVGGVAGQVGGVTQPGRTIDVGASAGQFVSDTVQTISALPPAALALLVVLVFVGLVALRRAF